MTGYGLRVDGLRVGVLRVAGCVLRVDGLRVDVLTCCGLRVAC